MVDVLERVKQLIDLATNEGASEEEARTTALIACKLIKEHKLVISKAGSGKQASGNTPWGRYTPPPGWPADFDFEDLIQQVTKVKTKTANKKPPPPAPQKHTKMRVQVMTNTQVCGVCNKHISYGAEAILIGGRTIVHTACDK